MSLSLRISRSILGKHNLFELEASLDGLIQEFVMKKVYEVLLILVVLSLPITACGTRVLRLQVEEQPAQKAASYEVVLGKSMTNEAVIGFIAMNNCFPADQFQLCKEVGMALWIDSNQIVKTIYLYAGNEDGFKRYRGKLPFDLTFYDPMWRVQEKLKNQNTDKIDQAGLPDEASSPDHMHYWAVYKRWGMTIIYNAPFADEDAYIYAILIYK